MQVAVKVRFLCLSSRTACGLRLKKFLVPTQLTAPELELKCFSRTERPAEAGDYITTKRPNGQYEN